jgi:hypothetical protein
VYKVPALNALPHAQALLPEANDANDVNDAHCLAPASQAVTANGVEVEADFSLLS